MKIEHIAMYVQDLEREKRFFEIYFQASAGERYNNFRTGFSSYFLTFEDGARLELMTRLEVQNREKLPYRTGFHHLSISVGDRDAVDRLTRWMQNDGYTVVSGPRVTGDGYYESCVLDEEGNQIEITE